MGISNDYRVDALLRAADARWNGAFPFGTPTEVTYGFMDTLPSYFLQPGILSSGQDASTFSALDSARRDLVRNEFAELSNKIPGLKFAEVSDPNAAVVMIGALRYDATALGDAMGYTPNGGDTSGNLNAAGDVWFNLNSVKYDLARVYVLPDGTSVNIGKIQFEDMALHEIGHALGLKHPGNYTQFGGGGVGSNAPPYLPANEDNSTNTVMSYNGDYAGPDLRPYDIAALDFLYGATPPSSGQWLLAVGGSSVIAGSSLNELVMPGQGTHSIDGGAGTDTVSLSGNRQNFSITQDSSGRFLVADKSGSGVDTLTNVERLQFPDDKLALDMGAGQAGGEVALLIGAVVGKASLSDAVLVGQLLSFFDGGYTLHDAANVLVNAGVMDRLAGGSSTSAYVNWIYKAVVGQTATADVTAALAPYIDSYGYSKADFLATVAALPLNQTNIGLVGLQQTGIEYS